MDEADVRAAALILDDSAELKLAAVGLPKLAKIAVEWHCNSIAMELPEGQTLKHRIGTKPLRIDELLDLAIQVADGLDAAHERYRDGDRLWAL